MKSLSKSIFKLEQISKSFSNLKGILDCVSTKFFSKKKKRSQKYFKILYNLIEISKTLEGVLQTMKIAHPKSSSVGAKLTLCVPKQVRITNQHIYHQVCAQAGQHHRSAHSLGALGPSGAPRWVPRACRGEYMLALWTLRAPKAAPSRIANAPRIAQTLTVACTHSHVAMAIGVRVVQAIVHESWLARARGSVHLGARAPWARATTAHALVFALVCKYCASIPGAWSQL